MENKECESSDMFELEIKLKDKLLELQTKRTVLKELDNKMQKLQLDKHDYQRTVEKSDREMKEMSVQLEVAISVARNSETDRITNREILAMQKVQLQAAIMDRENLQEQVRNLEVENVKLKRCLQQTEEKLVKQHLLQERCKNKENQFKSSVEHLASQIKSVEESQEKLMHIHTAVHQTSQNITHQLNSKTNLISKLESEKLKLQQQVLSHTIVLPMEEQTDKNNILDTELENTLKDMENANKEKEKEINDLQKSLDTAFKSIKSLQEKNKSFEDEIKALKSEKCKCLKSHEISQVLDKTSGSPKSDGNVTSPEVENKGKSSKRQIENDAGKLNKKVK